MEWSAHRYGFSECIYTVLKLNWTGIIYHLDCHTLLIMLQAHGIIMGLLFMLLTLHTKICTWNHFGPMLLMLYKDTDIWNRFGLVILIIYTQRYRHVESFWTYECDALHIKIQTYGINLATHSVSSSILWYTSLSGLSPNKKWCPNSSCFRISRKG